MPKQIDHDQRKQVIAEATWRVILRDGMSGATVRNIAREAEISPGSLRNDFTSQESLLRYAMNLVKERAGERILFIANQDLPPKEKVLGMLLEIVPTDEQTRAEMEVWFVFTAHCSHQRERFDVGYDGIRNMIRLIFLQLQEWNSLKPDIHLELEIEKLYALVDGLALHAMLEPGRLNRDKIKAILESHLSSVCLFPS
ncbi:TetR/AcrR family transcriptional regulator [Paenibacillus sp. A14]|uniref:TetR/AcrR family transcriptional regulator n=1 Tax=Paenibacillus sp. A14 TaxID=3119820 RepID=UPI002FE00457